MRCCATVGWPPDMVKRWRRISWALAMAVAIPASGASASTVYITDSVSVALFPSQALSGEPVQRLLSGTPVEVLDSNEGITQIRTGDGQTGWVRSSFLTTSVPAVIQLDEMLLLVEALQDELALSSRQVESLEDDLAAANEQLAAARKSTTAAKNVGWLKGELKKSRARAEQAEKELAQRAPELAQLQQQLTSAEQQIAELTAAREELYVKLAASELILADTAGAREAQEAGSGRLALLWSALAVLVALAIGFVAGYRWLDRKLLQRFGGIRFH